MCAVLEQHAACVEILTNPVGFCEITASPRVFALLTERLAVIFASQEKARSLLVIRRPSRRMPCVFAMMAFCVIRTPLGSEVEPDEYWI